MNLTQKLGKSGRFAKVSRLMFLRQHLIILIALALLLTSGCAAPQIKLFTDAADPLKEFTLSGREKGKVLVVHIRGIISDHPSEKFIRSKPSMVQEIVSQLMMAEKDDEIQAVLLKINTPGGTTTASDILYHELMAYKKRTGTKVVVAMMDLATSGGYYVSLSADFILAHPTTVTGSIGVVYMRPNVTGFMNKLGLDMQVNKSGKNKDMGSPFRQTTEEEQKILQGLTDELGKRFVHLVAKHRRLDKKTLTNISTARVYLAGKALELGLVDEIGYLNDALSKAKDLAGLSKDAKVVVYRRTKYPNDNLYNPTTYRYGPDLSLIDLSLPEVLTSTGAGFYYIWPSAAGQGM